MNSINKSVIASEDIFLKASIRYCERMDFSPREHAFNVRDGMKDLAERILALKEVGAL